MDDDKLIEQMANIWVSNGGDRVGLCVCLLKLLDKIEELSNVKEFGLSGNTIAT